MAEIIEDASRSQIAPLSPGVASYINRSSPLTAASDESWNITDQLVTCADATRVIRVG